MCKIGKVLGMVFIVYYGIQTLNYKYGRWKCKIGEIGDLVFLQFLMKGLLFYLDILLEWMKYKDCEGFCKLCCENWEVSNEY